MITPNSLTTAQYLSTRYSLLLQLEEGGTPQTLPYLDSKQIPTMGIGFNLRVGLNLDEVLQEMGFDLQPNSVHRPYVTQIRSALAQTYLNGQTGSSLRPALDSVMASWAADPRVVTTNGSTKRASFTLTQPEVINAFRDIAPRYETGITAWEVKYGLTTVPESRERAALFSLSWNSQDKNKDGVPDLLGAGLARAFQNGDRAEAWFEIRYNSNGDKLTGIAKRRFIESEVFGLYDDPAAATLAEAKAAYQMLQKRRPTIYAYEALYGLTPDGTRGTQRVASGKTGLELAVSEGASIANTLDDGKVDSLVANLVPARDAFVTWVNTQLPQGETPLTAANWNPAAIYFRGPNISSNMLDANGDNGKSQNLDKNLLVGDDRSDDLRGGTGNDVLIGAGGDDTLEGGQGADTLYGGQGADLYVWNTGDGNDRIVDPDGGRLVINGGSGGSYPVSVGGVMTKDATSNVWRDATGNVVLTHNSPWRIELSDGSVIELGEDFDPAEWGITLGEQPVAPTVTIIGDKDYGPDPDHPLKDEWGNPAGDAAPDREDTLTGSAGNDSIEGLGGRDQIRGDAGGDIIEGGAAADIIVGGAGADQLFGNVEIGLPQATADGDTQDGTGIRGDWLNGGAGDDIVVSGADNDVLFGGDGRDILVGGAGDDVMDGDDDYTATSFDWTVTDYGNPFDRGWSPITVDSAPPGAADVLYGGAGNDFLAGLAGDDHLYGGAGNDTLGGQDNDDMLFGGVGDDKMTGDYGSLAYDSGAGTVIQGDDYMDGGDGNDWMQGEAGDDELFGGEGDDQMWGDAANYAGTIPGKDYLDGEGGNDQLTGGGSDDVLFGGEGNDILLGDGASVADAEHGNDYLDGEAGNDQLRGYGGDDEIFGGDGADTLQGDAGMDYLDGEAGDDLLFSGDGDDTLYGDAGKDELQGGAGNDELSGETENDRLFGEDGDDYLDGGDGSDLVVAGAGNDSAFGGSGSDQLGGGAGQDYLDGEGDNDELQGGEDDDVLYGGSGDDVLFGEAGSDAINGDDGNDQLQGGDGNDIVNGGSGNDLAVGDAGDDILSGDDGGDELQGGIGNDVLNGGADNDVLFGQSGSDTLDGGAGNDILQGDTESDTYVFGRGGGNDTIFNYEVNGGSVDVLQFTADVSASDVYAYRDGTDQVYAIKNTDDSIRVRNYYAVTRSTYNPTTGVYTEFFDYRVEQVKFADGTTWTPSNTPAFVAGVPGINSAGGTTGNDTFATSVAGDIFYGGLGSDTYLWGARSGKDVVSDQTNGSETNTVLVDASVAPSDVTVRRVGDDAVLTISNSPDEMKITGAAVGSNGLFQIKFESDGTVWNLAQLLSTPTEGADQLSGTSGNDVMNGLGGNDTINGGSGTDTLNGGAGNDTLTIKDGVAYGGQDDDDISVINGAATADGGDGNDTLRASDSYSKALYGGAGNDVLISTSYSYLNDTLAGGLGDDTYYPGGAGRIMENADEGTDTVILTGSFSDFVLADNVENLRVDYSGLATGNGLDNVLIGGIYSNTFVGAAGNDTLDGGGGSDQLDGGSGNDTYLFARGRGLTTIVGETDGNGTLDRVLFAAGISPADVLAQRSGNDLVLAVRGTSDQVRVSAYFATASSVEEVHFADGTVWDAAAIQASVVPMPTSGNDLLTGTSGNDSIAALEGNDTVYGYAGNDTLDGGAGVDSLLGGMGDDTYVVDSPADSVAENAGEGVDSVQSSTSYTLSAEVENLALTGSAALAGTGNALANMLTGNSGANTLTGGGGNDTLNGGTGIDSLVGGAGDDTYVLDTASDIVTESSGEGTDTLVVGFTHTVGTNFENLTLTGVANINGTGNAAANYLVGNAGDNVLSGLGGVDTAAGGAGNDTYVVDSTADVVIENASEGLDLVQSTATHTLSANVENLTLTGTTAINGTGNTSNNVLTGNSGANVLAGGQGNDTYVVSTGDTVTENVDEGIDTVQTDIAVANLWANVENLTLTGSSRVNVSGNDLHNVIIGNTANNSLTGRGGDDRLEGGGGTDTLIGGAGNDYYVIDDSRDDVTELANEGTDTIQAAFSYTLGTENTVENLVLTGAATTGTGNGLANVITGNALNNTLSGLAGADTMAGGAGDDIFVVAETTDVVAENAGEGTDLVQSAVTYTLSANVENMTLTGTAAINGTGNALNNVLTGNSAVNSLTGGLGDDTYVVTAGDVVIENANEGIDTVQSGTTFSIGNTTHVENLTLTGSSVAHGTGNALDNVLTGNSGSNSLTGGLGNDTYVIGSGDTVIENLDEGLDTVLSSVTYTLAANVENLTLTGTSAINGTGNGLDNVLAGNSAANSLTGLGGNDTYIVGTGDTVVEAADGGIDTVLAEVSYSIATSAYVENLVLTTATALTATGNALNNVIVGSDGNNTINGGTGADTMSGGLGDDTYTVDNPGDVVIENAGEGTDTIQTTLSFVSGGNIENITLLGTATVNATGDATNNVLTGNTAANILMGNAGNDTLNGGGDSDTLIGGTGNDTYVYAAGISMVENVDEGTDTVQTSSTYTLGDNFENLTLTGTTAANGYGNAANNLINGADGANILDGGAGRDKIYGGAGNDTLYGGTGDELHGGAGDDVYLLTGTEMDCDVSVTDNSNFVSVFEYDGSGIDRVEGELNISLMSYYYYSGGYHYVGYIENATLTGTYGASLEGHDGDNILIGNAGNNRITGRAGADRLDGGAGNDTIIGGANATMIGGLGNDRFEIWDNSVTASMQGGQGEDYYYLYYGTGTVTENAAEGIDTVEVSNTFGGSYTLGANLENLVVWGETGIGNTLDNKISSWSSIANTLSGLAGNDTLDSSNSGGVDTLNGGTGNDTYIIGAGDVVNESVNEGTDTVMSFSTHTLAANVENLTLSGSSAINATGNSSNNVLTGNSASNVLTGGLGDDTYVVTSGDTVIENANEGTDTIQVAITYSIAAVANVENLVLTGTSAINATGNAGNNTLTGNSAANVLDGGAGIDTMSGGAGNDTYIVESAADVVTESAGEGVDTIQSSVTYTIAAATQVENLVLTGSQAIDGTGNALDNTLTGNTAANVLRGGQGNDTYVVNDLADTIVENLNEGTDTVQSSVVYSLGTNVENLVLTGSSSINGLGNGLHNTLTGNSGTNVLTGGQGDDTYVLGYGDTAVEYAGEGTDTVRSVTYEVTLGANIENLVLDATYPAMNGYGNELNNVLTGNSQGNTLDGGGGADTMTGGVGFDSYHVDNQGDDVRENLNEGTDGVWSGISYGLTANVENLTLTGSAISATGNELDNQITGNAIDNQLIGGAGNDVLDGAGGADTLSGGAGNDWYHVYTDAGDVVIEAAGEGIDTVQTNLSGYVLSTNVENVKTSGQGISVTGNELDNSFDAVDSWSDTLTGKSGNDTYAIKAGDVVIENDGEGTDTVLIGSTYTLGANVENLTLTGTLAADGTGNALNNVLTGNSAANVLTGGQGDDVYVVAGADVAIENAGEGVDTAQSSVTYALGANLENLTLTGTAAVNATGNSLDNVVTGNSGNNVLDGQGGLDTLLGGAGNDSYYVYSSATTVVENTGEGTDTVLSTIDYALGSNVENLQLTGPLDLTGTGNALDNAMTASIGANLLTGDAGNDTLDGGFGADTLVGGTGDDTYYVDNAGDTTVENAGEGTDTVRSRNDYVLAENFENLTLVGYTATYGTGNAVNNVLTGSGADNVLDGGAGADTMNGGAGDDVYFVDDLWDVVYEKPNAAEGKDTVMSAVTFTLDAELENLTLTGTAAIDGTGNSGANVLVGNSGANTLTAAAGDDKLDGGAGSDRLLGGAGSDTYWVDDAGDVIVEDTSDYSRDSVVSSVDFSLGASVENLTLAGAATSATGNTGDNVLIGNAANNLLDGGAGGDTMIGDLGNDVYLVDSTNDWVGEYMGEGTDEMRASITLTLPVNVEVLTLTGTAALSGSGNDSSNIIRGNAGANALDGAGGTDVLAGGDGTDSLVNGLGNGAMDGGAGNDTLTGSAASELLAGGAGNDALALGAGADVITFNKGDGADVVVTAGDGLSDDTLSLGRVGLSEIRLSRSGSDLLVKVEGTSDTVRLQGWYASTANQNVGILQVIVDSSADYAPGSSDTLRNSRVAQMNFTQLVSEYDAALAVNPEMGDWAPPEASLSSALLATSDTAALGGHLAWLYAQAGSVAGVDYGTAIGQLENGFGATAQDIGELPDPQPLVASAAEGGQPQAQTASDSETSVTNAEAATAESSTETPAEDEAAAARMSSEQITGSSAPADMSTSSSDLDMSVSTMTSAELFEAPVADTDSSSAVKALDSTYTQPAMGDEDSTASGGSLPAGARVDLWAQVDAWASLQAALGADGHDGMGGELQAAASPLFLAGGSGGLSDRTMALQQEISRIENVAQLSVARL